MKTPAGKSKVKRSERGLALMELMLITVPICVLSIVLASAIAATATAKNRSMWKASLEAQQATAKDRCGAPILLKPALSPRYPKHIGGYGKATIIASIGMPITRTGQETREVTEPVPTFHFEKSADKMFPDRAKEAQNSATFPCNEPGDPGDRDRTLYKLGLEAIAIPKARSMY